jgi:hypothetical protein
MGVVKERKRKQKMEKPIRPVPLTFLRLNVYFVFYSFKEELAALQNLHQHERLNHLLKILLPQFRIKKKKMI